MPERCVCWIFSLYCMWLLWDKNLTTSNKFYVLSEGTKIRKISGEFQAFNWVRCQCKVRGWGGGFWGAEGIHCPWWDLTVSTQCPGVVPNKVKQVNRETLPGTRGSSKRGCSHHPHRCSTPLLKITHQADVISCLDHDSSFLIGFLIFLTKLSFKIKSCHITSTFLLCLELPKLRIRTKP